MAVDIAVRLSDWNVQYLSGFRWMKSSERHVLHCHHLDVYPCALVEESMGIVHVLFPFLLVFVRLYSY